jgi:rod shape-determining protein MreC
MPLGTLDRSPPPLFKQGASALSKLMVCSAAALFLMVADARLKITQPIRTAIAAVVYPLQWALLQPVQGATQVSRSLSSVQDARNEQLEAQKRMALQAQRAQQSEQLALENTKLRALLQLREAVATRAQAAEVIYDAPDPYSRRVIIDKGLTHGLAQGSPVIDELGVVGQVTRVYPTVSEVTLLVDREFSMPVLNTRTGSRHVASGEPTQSGGVVELRFVGANADVQEGDVLTTSGIDGVYPPGLSVAKVTRIERRADSGFARIYCTPQSLVNGARHVMVLAPIGDQLPPRPQEAASAPPKPAGKEPKAKGAKP